MEIKDLAKKYNLDPKSDFWKHKQSGKWIITHDACEKIASMEGIHIGWNKVTGDPLLNVITNEPELVRLIVTMTNGNAFVTTSGEAGKLNCQSKYYLNMAEKRGVDRCILKLINAYEYGIYSDSEADAFKKPAIKNDPYAKHRDVEQVPMISKAQGREIIILETSLSDKIKHPIDFTDLTYDNAEKYITELEGMKNELSEV